MTLVTWFLLGFIVLLAGLVGFLIKAGSRQYYRAERYKTYWEQELDRSHKAEHQVREWRMRYESLLRDYNELAELDEGEDYVRESLGYPPDEDHEESA